MDCIISYRLNSLRSGVAKTNAIMAARFKIPMLGIYDDSILKYRQPLISLKVSELNDDEVRALAGRFAQLRQGRSLRLFLHDFTDTPLEIEMVKAVDAVYCGNAEVYAKVSRLTDRAFNLWVPPLLTDAQRFEKAGISVFSFGMAHKIQMEPYRRLRKLLDDTGESYSITVSTAFHESVSFDDSADVVQELQKVFEQHFYFTGFLSDAAVYNYLADTTFFVAFFPQGVRANNTTVTAAMQYGSVVITNLDKYSPESYVHMENIIDINRCNQLPTNREVLDQIRSRAKETAKRFSWESLVTSLARHENTRGR